MRRPIVILLLLAIAISHSTPLKAQARRPRLVVLLMVDQMRADYVDKFRHQWNGGLARLLSEGAWFRQAEYPYTNTVTCAGHASVSTGTLPSVHGMIMNTWWDRDFSRQVACADDPSSIALSYGKAFTASGQSAARLLAPTLADELRTQLSPAARVASFSLKARSAVTLAGQRPDVVAWVADEDAWATSTAYPQGQSGEVARFVSAHPVEHQLWTMWERALPASSYAYEEKALVAKTEDDGVFPHPIRTWEEWETSPLSDAYLGDMALDVAKSLRFGSEGRTDFLAISFSALDLVGHDYGPDSHEVQDVLIRLDRTIGKLLIGLDQLVGREHYVVALTSDHGVGPTPERGQHFGMDAGRIPARAIPDAATEAIRVTLGRGRTVNRLMNGDVYLEAGVMDALRGKPGAVDAVARALAVVPGVASVYSRDEIMRASGAEDAVLARIANGFVPSRSGDFVVVFKPYWLVGTANNANHGTGYGYDARVPIILAGAGIAHTEVARPVTPLDIAPTLAYLAGITLPYAQGRVLSDALAPVSHPRDSSSTR